MSKQAEFGPTDEQGSVPAEPDSLSTGKREANAFFKSSIGNLSAEELCTPTGVRFLIADIDVKQEQIDRLAPYVDLYHQTDKDVAILKSSIKTSRWNELLSALCLAVGSAGLGAAPGLVLTKQTFFLGVLLASLSILLVVGSVLFRADIAFRLFGRES